MNMNVTDLLKFIETSPSPWHAVQALKARRTSLELDEKKAWALKLGESYQIERSGASWATWSMPKANVDLEQLRFHIVAAHTDSPALKLKPNAPTQEANYHQWGVEIYGGTLYNTWLDRDLGIAGIVHWVEAEQRRHALILDAECKIRVPQLAIHLDRDVNEQGLKLNPQRHLVPVLGLNEGKDFTQWLRQQSGAPQDAHLMFDLWLFDTLAPTLGGMNSEFIYSARLDNLAMCHAGLSALNQVVAKGHTLPLFCCFNHEEVGSASTEGASSNFLPNVLERVCLELGLTRAQHLACLRRSFLISADMAHALHPNYKDRHESNHQPLLGKGPVLKGNANMRYAGSAATHLRFDQWCREAGVSAQNFINRADLGCGSTIGPCLASKLGIDTIDVGNPMLSMHSAREMSASSDHERMIAVMKTFLEDNTP